MRITVGLDGAAELSKAMRQAPDDLRRDMRRTGKAEVSDPLAAKARQDAAAFGPQAAAAARSTRGVSGNLPTIRVGGARRAGVSGGATFGQLAPGTVFGSNRFGQFPPRRVRSYWFLSSVDRHGPAALRHWRGIFETLERKWRNVR